ncbi:hypothetical protein QEG73_00720 [Chitinophagaceae bacterium 26-R-25]|nr:hypothetical protein [Chitinophagaceae bacterium 26-R-25]
MIKKDLRLAIFVSVQTTLIELVYADLFFTAKIAMQHHSNKGIRKSAKEAKSVVSSLLPLRHLGALCGKKNCKTIFSNHDNLENLPARKNFIQAGVLSPSLVRYHTTI